MSFDERMRLRAKMEDCPLPPGFLGRLETKAEEIAEGEERPMKKRVFRTILLAAALCAALTVAAMAASPTLREALLAALGSFEPYSQTMEGVSAVDGGIEIKVVSALMDEADGTAYLEVRDLEGDRLGENMRLKLNVSGRWQEPIAYDETTKTALFAIDLGVPIYELRMGREEKLTLICETIFPGRVELPCEEVPCLIDGTEYTWERGTDIPKDLYTDQVLKTRPLTEKEKEGHAANAWDTPVLLPDQTPADLGSPYFSLSSLGFDEDGVFHIQLALTQGFYLSNAYSLDLDLIPGFWPEDLGLEGGLSRRCILLEGGRYVDVSYKDIGPDMIERLPAATVTGAVYTQPPIQGEWRLSFPYMTQPTQETVLKGPFGGVEGVAIEKVQLTAMSLRITFSGETDHHFMGGHKLHLFCKDGTILRLGNYDQTALYQNETGEWGDDYTLSYEQKTQGEDGWQYRGERDSWSYPRAVEPGDVTGFSWGLWYVPLKGEAAGRGYWLPQLPVATE